MEVSTTKSKILTPRLPFKPFDYQWAYDYWFQQQNAHWMFQEINMQKDIGDWKSELNEQEKSVVGNILKGFFQSETQIADYWSTYVTKWFPIPEIKMMAITFGSFETIHAVAYSYLNEVLHLEDYEAFLHDTAIMAKLEMLINVDDNDTSLENIARSLALFSACAEGIQLFSSFAIMLSLRKKNLMTGIGQQMIFSIRDESLHSEAGCKLFRTLIEENPQIWTEQLRNDIKDGFGLALSNEFNFIDKVFEMGDLDTITKAQVKNFMYDRANRKLRELGITDLTYDVNEELLLEMDWFYILVSGEQQTDFFFNRETGYAKPNADWETEDLF
jgi:ribonucleoside-diphosphate reductase beta chain